MKQSVNESFSNSIKTFFQEQLAEWPLVESNYEALKRVRVKDFDLGGSSVRIQFNPKRLRSSKAKTDNKSIQERRCFLCPEHLLAEQRGIPFGKDYQVLVNPFPIFPMHLTVPTMDHVDQLIFDRYEDMLDLAAALGDFVVFYNGPKSGASAPDHMHFQAGNKGFLSLEKDISTHKREILISGENVLCYLLPNYFRNVIVIKSDDKDHMVALFNRIYAVLAINEGEKEPKLNIVSWCEHGKWISCIFPRTVHRPQCFYAEGDDNILLSPASVDLSGVCVLPLEKDFDKITAEDIKAVFKEICIDDQTMKRITDDLIKD